MKIDARSASIEALMLAIGENLREHIKAEHSIQQFCKDTGVPSSTLYRFFDGENVSADNFLRVLRGAGMLQAINEMLRPPEESPVTAWRSETGANSESRKTVGTGGSARRAIRAGLGRRKP